MVHHAEQKAPSTMLLDRLTRRAESFLENAGSIGLLFARGLGESPALWRGRQRFLLQLARIGADSLPLVLMIGLFTGMVLALQTGLIFKDRFGAEEQVGTAVGMVLVREMGPVITAFLLAGRAGSAIAAELGTMAVSEEIDALRSMGISPVAYLFVPRLWAMVLMEPILTVFSVMIGIWGGGLIVASVLNFPAEVYYHRLYEAVRPADIAHGFSKTFVFGALIATISTHMGLRASRGAEGVGRATTGAVVVSLSMVLIADYLMTSFFRL